VSFSRFFGKKIKKENYLKKKGGHMSQADAPSFSWAQRSTRVKN